ncbi:MAG: hypothetical protein ABEI98_02555 [Halorhabdus sp.]
MTAERWWVRLGARWLARVEAVAPMIRMGMLTLTGVSTALVALKSYGYGEFAWPLVGLVSLGGVAFTWLYTEGGVFNQQRRDHSDLGDNYSGPTMLLEKRIQARQMARLAHSLQNGETDLDDLEDEMVQVTTDEWSNLRDGVDIDEVDA